MKNKKSKMLLFAILTIIIILIIVLIGKYNKEIFRNNGKNSEENKTENTLVSTEGISIVPTMQDSITQDALWCSTFQLIWNDLKDEIAKQDIVFREPNTMVDNLNKSEFTTNMISDEYYYKKYGIVSNELKEEIEKGIKDKFGENSSIINDFNWERKGDNQYFLYAMLKRKFDFINEFDNLEKSDFGNKYKDISYFGINNETKGDVRKQVEVIYYNSKYDFAIQIGTKQKDEVILCKGNEGKNFKEIYDKVQNTQYTGRIDLSSKETLKIPNLEFKEKKEFKELEGKEFKFSTGELYYIDKAIQTIEFKLDKKGGEVKSEAGMMTLKSAIIEPSEDEVREFNLDDTFTVFLKEEEKELPYFAAKISDITKFQ